MMHSNRKKLGREDNYVQDYIEQTYLFIFIKGTNF